MSERSSSRPGSARAKLESFNRMNKGKDSMMKKMLIVFFLMIIALALQFIISKSTGSNAYFELPKNAAWMVREGEWEKLRELCADDFHVVGTDINSADEFIDFLSQYGKDGVSVYASVPHKWLKGKGSARLEFWVIWARGKMDSPSTIPITKTWRIDCGLIDDGDWKLKDAKILPSVAAP